MNRKPLGTKPAAEKAKNVKQAFANLILYIKPFMPLIIISTILAVLSSVLSILGPNKLKEMTNIIAEGFMTKINLSKLEDIAIILVLFYSFSFIFNYLQGFIMATVTNKFSKKLRNEISNKINELPLKYFDNNSIGDILSRVTNDIDTISQSINQSIGTLVSSTTLLIGSIVMMFVTNYILALTAIFSTIAGFALMILILKKSQKYFDTYQKELGNINGYIEEIYTGHNIVKVYNGTEKANKEFNKINKRLYESSRKSQFLSGLMHPIMNFIGNFGYVAVCIIGAILVINGHITFGVIVAFMIYIRLFSQPLTQIAQATTVLQSTAAASERVFEFLKEEAMPEEKNNKPLEIKNVKGNVSFEHVKFGYNQDKIIIKDFSTKIKAGQKIAIVGPTGAGKTTIVNLLMKFYDLNSGDIKIDNISLKDLTRENIHDLFVMVLQDTWIFNDTIKQNIKYNKKNVTDKEIENACKRVELDHFIKTLPDGYDTVLTDSESLSVGQKQLLTIARGMVKSSPLLILDEATSSVDTRTEELVQKAMDKLTEGKTSFIIAHRLSTIKNADLILVMNNGNIIEQGTHKSLLKQNGFYAELYNSQFENIN